jgi:hypothetical protein
MCARNTGVKGHPEHPDPAMVSIGKQPMLSFIINHFTVPLHSFAIMFVYYKNSIPPKIM